VDRDAHLGIVEALSRAQVEALLVDGRGDLRDAAAVADDPAGEHECLAEGVEVSQRVDGVFGADDGDLASRDQRADAGVDRDVVQAADVLPSWRRGAHDRAWRHPASRCRRCFFSSHPAGLCWARTRIFTRLGSGADEFTKVRKRASLAGSSTVLFHSHWYVATMCAISASSSAQMPSESWMRTSRRYSMPPSRLLNHPAVRCSRSAVRT